jgi:hypothetical protein
MFDVLEEWFREDNFPSCLFINCLIETHDELGQIRAASVRGIEEVYAILRQLERMRGLRIRARSRTGSRSCAADRSLPPRSARWMRSARRKRSPGSSSPTKA